MADVCWDLDYDHRTNEAGTPPATPTLAPLVERALRRELAQRRRLLPHAQLGIPIDAPPAESEAAFRRLERQYEPQSYSVYGAAAVAAAAEISALLGEAHERMRQPGARGVAAEPALPRLEAAARGDETRRALETLRGAITRRIAEAEQHKAAGRIGDAIRVLESVLVLDRTNVVARAELDELRSAVPSETPGRWRRFLQRVFGR